MQNPMFPAARLVELRVKIKALAAEARLIRREEGRCKARRRWITVRLRSEPDETQKAGLAGRGASLLRSQQSLRDHRTGVVRREARYSQLAYAILRGRAWQQVEPTAGIFLPDMAKLQGLVQRFGNVPASMAAAAVSAWLMVPRAATVQTSLTTAG